MDKLQTIDLFVLKANTKSNKGVIKKRNETAGDKKETQTDRQKQRPSLEEPVQP